MSRDISSFCGVINEVPNIAVDNFTIYNRKAYFLSHYHADHISGLNSYAFLNNLRKTNAKIYMSEVTCVIADYEDVHSGMKDNLLQYIIPLKLGSATITLRGDDETGDEYLQVKLIPAGHCLGSVMFLFNYKEQTILYTGDFRMKPENLPHYGQLHKRNEPIKIDVMYLDTTFQDVDHNNFPSRKESVQKMIELIKDWLEIKENRVAVYARTKYAYEFVFNEIYKQTGFKVYVDDFKWNLYRKLPEQIVGVTNDINENRIHLCPKKYSDHTKCMPYSSPANYLYIYMSAYKWSRSHEECPYIEDLHENSKGICFSTHCSRSELIYFVNYFSPEKVVGFRKPYSGASVTGSYDDDSDDLLFSQPTPKKVKSDIKPEKRVDKKIIMKAFDW